LVSSAAVATVALVVSVPLGWPDGSDCDVCESMHDPPFRDGVYA
jgi:hypothetical protein